MEEFTKNISERKLALITVRFHPLDMETYQLFFNTILLPFALSADYYFINIEHKCSLEEHCHIVISYGADETIRDLDKIKQKLKSKKIENFMKTLSNTKLDDKSIDVKPIENTQMDKYRSIGYLLKQGQQYWISNTKEQLILDMVYNAYITLIKEPIHKVDHKIEYKNVNESELLLYYYDHHKKNIDIPLDMLDQHMVANTKLSTWRIGRKRKEEAIEELKLKLNPKILRPKKDVDKIAELENQINDLQYRMSPKKLEEQIQNYQRIISKYREIIIHNLGKEILINLRM